MQYLRPYVVTLAVVIVLDLLWLGVVASGFYRAQLGHLLADGVYWPAAILFYICCALGLMVFVIVPALASRSVKKAALMGAVFGFMAYMTYDLTNMATMRDWPLLVTIADIVWGMVLTTIAALAATMFELRATRAKQSQSVATAPVSIPTVPPAT